MAASWVPLPKFQADDAENRDVNETFSFETETFESLFETDREETFLDFPETRPIGYNQN